MDFNDAYNAMKKGKKVKCKNNIISFGDDRLILENVNNTLEDINRDMVTLLDDVFSNDWEIYEEQKSKDWKPREGELYFYINSNGEIEYRYYKNRNINDKRRICNIGNYFKTDEEADHMVEKLKVIKELKDFAIENRDEEISWEEDDEYNRYKYSIYFDYRLESIRINWTTVAHDSPFNLYFTSLEIAKEAIKKIGEDRIKKYYFDIED